MATTRVPRLQIGNALENKRVAPGGCRGQTVPRRRNTPAQYVITNCEEGKGRPPRLFFKTGYPLGHPEPALQQKTEERELCHLHQQSYSVPCVVSSEMGDYLGKQSASETNLVLYPQWVINECWPKGCGYDSWLGS